jgi:hypothetical protein
VDTHILGVLDLTECVGRVSLQCVATLRAPSILAPGPLSDAMCSSRGGAPSRPWVAAVFGAAFSALVDRPCAGQLALHMASTVRGCDALAALNYGPGLPRRRDALLPKRYPLETTGSGRLWGGLLRIGRLSLCRPVGLAHGLDRAQLRRPSRTQIWPRAPSVTRCPPPGEAPPRDHG